MRKISTAIVALATLALAAPASASEIWLNGWSPNSDAGLGDRYFSDGTVNVRVSAWSIAPNDTIRAATLGMWEYGLGVQHSDYGRYDSDQYHTVDNRGWTDFLVLQFDEAVTLENALFVSDSSWGAYDTDATIGFGNAFPGLSAPSLQNTSLSSLEGLATLYDAPSNSDIVWQSSSWYGPDFSFRNVNSGGNSGNFWLVGASFADEYYDGKKDGFKLKQVTYTIPTPSVPEPGTWLMMILGFGLVGGVMRREKRKGAPALA